MKHTRQEIQDAAARFLCGREKDADRGVIQDVLFAYLTMTKPVEEPHVCDLCGKPTEELNAAPGVDMGGKYRHADCIPY